MSLRLVALLYMAAAMASAGDSGKLEVEYQWSNGSVAPQYFTIHRATIRSDGRSEISLIRATGITGETFTADANKLRALLDYIHANRLDSSPLPPAAASASRPPAPGDGTCLLSFVVNSMAYSVPCKAPKVAGLLVIIRDIVPSAILQRLDAAPLVTGQNPR